VTADPDSGEAESPWLEGRAGAKNRRSSADGSHGIAEGDRGAGDESGDTISRSWGSPSRRGSGTGASAMARGEWLNAAKKREFRSTWRFWPRGRAALPLVAGGALESCESEGYVSVKASIFQLTPPSPQRRARDLYHCAAARSGSDKWPAREQDEICRCFARGWPHMAYPRIKSIIPSRRAL